MKYVFALSLVIRLWQWKDEALHGDTAAALPSKDLLSREKTVERYMKQLYRVTRGSTRTLNKSPKDSEPGLEDLLRAICHSLIIYF